MEAAGKLRRHLRASPKAVETDRVARGRLRAAHVLSGPLPAVPVPYTPVAHRTIHMAENDFIAFGATQLLAMHDDLMRAAVGGDLARLKPAAVKVVRQ